MPSAVKTISVRLPEDEYWKLKEYTLHERTTMQTYILDLVRKDQAKEKTDGERRKAEA